MLNPVNTTYVGFFFCFFMLMRRASSMGVNFLDYRRLRFPHMVMILFFYRKICLSFIFFIEN